MSQFEEKIAADYQAAKDALARLLASFPESREFGLKSYPGRRFRVSRAFSFVAEFQPKLYLQIFFPADGVGDDRWLDFSKVTEEELSELIVPIPERVFKYLAVVPGGDPRDGGTLISPCVPVEICDLHERVKVIFPGLGLYWVHITNFFEEEGDNLRNMRGVVLENRIAEGKERKRA